MEKGCSEKQHITAELFTRVEMSSSLPGRHVEMPHKYQLEYIEYLLFIQATAHARLLATSSVDMLH